MTKFASGQSGNPSGRPKGTKNKATARHAKRLETLIDTKGDDLIKVAIDMAKTEPSVMTALLDRLIPKLKPVAREMPAPIKADATAEENASSVMQAMSAGEISIDDGAALLDAINQKAHIERFPEIERALVELYKAMGKEPPAELAARTMTTPKVLQ